MRILRTTNLIIDEFRTRLQALSETINYVRGKVDHMSGLMTLATGGVSELVKKMVAKKAKDWVDEGTDSLNEAARSAVDKAVEETAKKMKKATAKMRKR
jgi:DNA-binding protein YbaB